MSVMSKKLTDALTFHEKIQVCRRLWQEVCQLDRSFVPMTALLQILTTAGSYIGIYVSAMVLNGLVTEISMRELVYRTIFWLAVGFVLSILSGWVRKKCERIKMSSWDGVAVRKNGKSMEMDWPDFESPYVNELYSRMQEDNNWGDGIYGAYRCIEDFFLHICNVLFAIGMMVPVMHQLWENRSLLTYVYFGVLIVMIVVNAAGTNYFGEKLHKIMQRWPKNEPEKINLMWYFMYNGTPEIRKDIKLYHARPLLEEYVFEHGKEWIKQKEEDMAKESGKKDVFGNVFSAGVSGVCYFFLTLMAVGGSILVGDLVRYVACFERLTTSIQQVISNLMGFLLVARRQSSTFEFLDSEGKLYHGTLPVEKRRDNEYEIEFRNVSFRYPGSEEYALKDFSLKMRIGEKMALVGKNGSGKTTMIKLLCRLYDPTEGEILLNGVDVRKFDYREYMKLFSIVFQDFSMFDFSIAENVATSSEYDEEQIRDCLVRAGFGKRLEELENGIDTYVGEQYDEGVKMSGGEKQKIAIARALYRASPFILLDEPTAALDPVAEYEIYSAFNEMVGSKTAVYISHRLSSCRFCNDIVVFDQGKIVQRGSHEKLMKEPEGLYHSLWTAQAQYY
ncbi:MAG: ABC transporter ATP-binding protein/permease [Roseburia sp.]|nr:ABC transporter ATP-binding protein/permease [Roseburia sp.]